MVTARARATRPYTARAITTRPHTPMWGFWGVSRASCLPTSHDARDVNSDKKLDKDRFRKGLGNLIEAYQEVARRLDILHEQSNIRPLKYTKPQAVKIKKK